MHRRLLLVVPVLAGLTACVPGTSAPPRLVVFFNADSAALDDAARAVIQQASSAARSNPFEQVKVLGFAAPDTGTAAFNRVLSQARAQNVADGLIAAGVSASRVRIQSRGAVSFDMMPMESRRVEIVIGS
jgi:outer membrane protein OmpA-like peptidoglycan-associated protein